MRVDACVACDRARDGRIERDGCCVTDAPLSVSVSPSLSLTHTHRHKKVRWMSFERDTVTHHLIDRAAVVHALAQDSVSWLWY